MSLFSAVWLGFFCRVCHCALFDDFTGTNYDGNTWTPGASHTLRHKGDVFYNPGAVTLANGCLKITLSPYESFFMSGSMSTKDRFAFQYGEVEVRAKLTSRRSGVQHIFNLHPVVEPQEPGGVLNVFGEFAVQEDDTFYAAAGQELRDKSYNATGVLRNSRSPSHVTLMMLAPDDFFIYQVKWKPATIEWYFNGQVIPPASRDVVATAPTSMMYIELLLEYDLQHARAGEPFENNPSLLIDYIRVTDLTDNSQTQPILLGVLIPLFLLLAAGAGYFIWRRCYSSDSPKQPAAGIFSGRNVFVARIKKQPAIPLNPAVGAHTWEPPDFIRDQPALADFIRLLEVPAESVQIDQQLLGSGSFGIVKKGIAAGLKGADQRTPVAVKSVRDSNSRDQQRALYVEMAIMCKSGRHLNILNILGVVLEGNPLLLTELCCFGSLLRYLQTHRGPAFINLVDMNGNLKESNTGEPNGSSTSTENGAIGPEAPEEDLLTTNELMDFAYQAATGMGYLVSRGIIHRDLAARNLLLASEKIIKISDFGLAKQQNEYILDNGKGAVPLRWMPPEAILKWVFSQKSDVWSFGILLWEMFTLGQDPYRNAGLSLHPDDFAAALNEGYRLDRPNFCPTTMYIIIRRCWEQDPLQRPLFEQLKIDLGSLVPAVREYVALEEPYEKFNKDHRELLDDAATYEGITYQDLDIKVADESRNIGSVRSEVKA